MCTYIYSYMLKIFTLQRYDIFPTWQNKIS